MSTMNISHMDDSESQYPYAAPWARNPLMQCYQPQNSGPLSWGEEQRVYRALWRLQLFFDLQQAAREEAKLEWPREDLQKILSLGPEEFWDPMQHDLLEELRVVKECVSSLYPDWPMWQLPTYRGNICYNWPAVTLKGEKYSSDYLDQPAPVYYLIKYGLTEDDFSPLPYVGFRPFRRYGLAIWDRKRLIVLELMGVIFDDDYPGVCLSITDEYYTWRSLLTKEDLEHWEWKRQQILDGNLTYCMYTEM